MRSITREKKIEMHDLRQYIDKYYNYNFNNRYNFRHDFESLRDLIQSVKFLLKKELQPDVNFVHNLTLDDLQELVRIRLIILLSNSNELIDYVKTYLEYHKEKSVLENDKETFKYVLSCINSYQRDSIDRQLMAK